MASKCSPLRLLLKLSVTFDRPYLMGVQWRLRRGSPQSKRDRQRIHRRPSTFECLREAERSQAQQCEEVLIPTKLINLLRACGTVFQDGDFRNGSCHFAANNAMLSSQSERSFSGWRFALQSSIQISSFVAERQRPGDLKSASVRCRAGAQPGCRPKNSFV